MSNALAIAATTATLRALLIARLGIPDVTARPPDKARDGIGGDQVNLFLFQTAPSAAWRNRDMPRQVKPGESGQPPLPLTLTYLLTAYSDDKDEVKSQILLGKAMSVLHDHPLLGQAEIENASTNELEDADLHQQLERVRITLEPLPLEELSKLWTACQTSFRTSAAYKADLVLIESTRPAATPLPVLQRGKDDQGPASQPDLESPYPALYSIALPERQASARLGDELTLVGLHLDAGALTVRLSHPLLDDPDLPPPILILPGATATEVRIRLVDDPARWVAGFYTVAALLENGGEVRATNELPLTVAPRIALPAEVIREAPLPGEDAGPADIDVKFSPPLRGGQRVRLLLGSREAPPSLPLPALPADGLIFRVEKAPLGKHVVRLRIDGVDSIPFDLAAKEIKFADDQKVEIHD